MSGSVPAVGCATTPPTGIGCLWFMMRFFQLKAASSKLESPKVMLFQAVAAVLGERTVHQEW